VWSVSETSATARGGALWQGRTLCPPGGDHNGRPDTTPDRAFRAPGRELNDGGGRMEPARHHPEAFGAVAPATKGGCVASSLASIDIYCTLDRYMKQ
jgi:hypothetical protein